MPSSQVSRRWLLSVTATTVAAAAGCLEGSDADDTEPDEETVEDLETEHLRTDATDPIVSVTGADDADHSILLLENDDVSDLEFVGDPDGLEDVRSFLEGVDYGDATVVVYQGEVSECHERRVEYVRGNEETFDLQFCRVTRDADVECETEQTDLQATFVEIPFAYDSPPNNSIGSSSSCRTGGER